MVVRCSFVERIGNCNVRQECSSLLSTRRHLRHAGIGPPTAPAGCRRTLRLLRAADPQALCWGSCCLSGTDQAGFNPIPSR